MTVFLTLFVKRRSKFIPSEKITYLSESYMAGFLIASADKYSYFKFSALFCVTLNIKNGYGANFSVFSGEKKKLQGIIGDT